uniref:Fumarylacetoacetate (FAA) hydrolase n=1 Tax=Mycobacterium sp. (strain JLS) TaxID=164757 RepID=A0A5Q5CGR0_MYCSJ
MKIATVLAAGRPVVTALGPAEQLVNVARLLSLPDLTVATLIADADRLLPKLAAALSEPVAAEAVLDSADISWLAPQPHPSKIVGVAVNNSGIAQFAYRQHVEPAYFLKPPSALTGHGEPIVVPPEYGLTHPEPELAAIIGRRIKAVQPEQALEAIFGYTIINDITSPALKDRDSMELRLPSPVGADLTWRETHGEKDSSLYLTYHARSKGSDTFAPMGPWITTRDEVVDPNALAVDCWLDDELVVSDSTSKLTFPIQDVIAHLSNYMTLEPGDVVHFGTAVQPGANPKFPTLRHLDMSSLNGTLSVEIAGLGRLDNPIAHK